jgi:hypothetical protein
MHFSTQRRFRSFVLCVILFSRVLCLFFSLAARGSSRAPGAGLTFFSLDSRFPRLLVILNNNMIVCEQFNLKGAARHRRVKK